MKKWGWLAGILCFSVILALFAIDLFLTAVPKEVFFALLGMMVAMTFFLIAKGSGRFIVGLTAVLTVVAVSAALCGIYLNPYYNGVLFHGDIPPTLPYDTVLSSDAACADMDYALRFFWKVHPKRDDAAVRKAAEEGKARIRAAGSVTVNALAAEIERALSKVGDAHTHVSRMYAEPLYLRHYYGRKKDGWRIAAINGISVEELLVQSNELYSFEAESWELESMKGDLLTLQGLDYLGFSTEDGITYSFENENGETQSDTYLPEDFVPFEAYLEYNGAESVSARDIPFVRFSIDETRSLALLTLDECTFNEEYVRCLKEMFSQVKAKGIQTVAVDLRENGGGNDQVALEFLRYLDTDDYRVPTYAWRFGPFDLPHGKDRAKNERYGDLQFHGKVYLLTSARTFSSAMLFAQYIKDNDLGTLIGEPPGNDPNGYGEITVFRTPHAGLCFSVSTKRFYRADRECADRYVMPDIDCSADDALECLYAQIDPS